MREELITLTKEQHARLEIIRRLMRRELKQKIAAEMLGLSTRQVRNLVRKVRQDGARGLAHGNRGKPSPKRLTGNEPGLVAYYRFDGNADDASGNGINGTAGGATWTTGVAGFAVHLAQGSPVVVPDNALLDTIVPGTIAMWIRPDEGLTLGSRWAGFYLKSSQSLPGVAFVYDPNAGELQIHSNSPWWGTGMGYKTSFQPGRWYHIAATLDLSERKLYIDGELVATGTPASALPTAPAPCRESRAAPWGRCRGRATPISPA